MSFEMTGRTCDGNEKTKREMQYKGWERHVRAIFGGTPSDIWRLSIFNPLGTKSKYLLSSARQFPGGKKNKTFAYAKVSRIRQFVLLVTSMYEDAYKTIGGMILTWEARNTDRKTFVNVTSSTTNPTWTHFELKAASVIRGRRKIAWAMARP